MEEKAQYTLEQDEGQYGNARFSILQARAVADTRISNAQFRTLAALAVFGDRDGWCWPSQSTLGDMLGKSQQAVSKDIKALIELGYVVSKPRYREDGSQTSNMYRLLFDSVVGGQPDDVGGTTSEVVGGTTSEVVPINDPINDPINNTPQLKKDEYLHRINQATSKGIANQARKQQSLSLKGVDITKYPEDVQDIISEVSSLWNLRPPSSSKGSQGGYWIKEARELKDACGEFGLEVLHALREQFKEHMAKNNGLAPFRVNSPKSLVNSARGVAAELREKGDATMDLSDGQYALPTNAREVWIGGKRYIGGQEA